MISIPARLVTSLKAWFFILAFVACGLLLSFWLYVYLDERHQRLLVSEFENVASQRVQVLDNHVQRSLEVLFGLAAFLQQPHNRQRKIFQDYVRGSLQRLPEVQALEWIPLITQSQRQTFELQAQQQGMESYEIIEFDGQGHLRPASQRERYFPVYFAYPETANVEALGLDLASNSDRLQAIEASLATGELVATAPVRLAQEKVAAVYGFLIFAPVYAPSADGQSSTGVSATQGSIEGFSLVVYRSIDLLASVFADMASKGIGVTVADQGRTDVTLYSNQKELQSVITAMGPRATRSYDIGRRHWQVLFAATDTYVTNKSQLNVYLYPLLSALLVLAFGFYAALRNRYLGEVEREVKSRTRDLTREVAIRRDAEAQAQQAEKMYRSIFENAIDGIFQTTQEGVYLNANTALARIYGYSSREEFIDSIKSIETQLYVNSERRADFIEIMQRDGKIEDFISEVYRADGRRIYVLEKAISIYDDKGSFLYYEGNVQDITDRIEAEKALQRTNEWLEERVSQRTSELAKANQELKEEVSIRQAAEQEAESANAAKTQFLAGISHEIRTPLNAIIGYSQILQQQKDLQEKHQLAIKTIAQSGNHLVSLIDDILDLSKIESGMVQLAPVNFDLSALVGNVAYIVRRKCEEKGLRLVVEGLGQRPVWVHGDDGKLRQILINLLSNAVKYTSQGEVILRVIPEDDNSYRFEVIDTGSGIPQKDIPNIFNQFFQRASWQEGTGLGLSIASRIALAMGTRLQVRSTLGLGSNFFFSLRFDPALKVPLPQTNNAATDVRLKAGQHCLALVVDDVQNNRDILQQMLETIGCVVVVAASGQEAMDYVKLQAPDIIFMDILMPGLDGIQSRQQILIQLPDLATVFVAFSASAFHEQRNTYLESGFNAVISKPFRIEQLHDCLRDLLQLQFDDCSNEPPSIDKPDFSGVNINQELCAALLEFAKYYNVTQLKRLLEELALLSAKHADLARYLRQLIEQHRLEEFIQVVTRI